MFVNQWVRLACVHKFGIKMYDIIRYHSGFKKQHKKKSQKLNF